MELKFEVEIHHESGKTFHTNIEITRSNIHMYDRLSSAKDFSQEQNEIVAKMLSGLMRIGSPHNLVDRITIQPYSISVFIRKSDFGLSRRWDDAIDHIVRKAITDLANKLPPKNMQIEKGLSLTLRTFHTNFEVSTSRIENYYRPIRQSSQQYLVQVGPKGSNLVTKLMKLPGIIEISIQPYEVMIEIAKLFDWEKPGTDGVNLTDKVKTIFSQVFGSDIVFS